MKSDRTLGKVEADLKFYFFSGLCVYGLQTLIYLVDYASRSERALTDSVFLGVFFALNMIVLHKIKSLRNWARRVFMIKFVVMAFFFYPQTWVLKTGTWMYAATPFLSVPQRILNFLVFAFEFFCCMHLVKRSVKYYFKR